jgi:hypothetical protein
MQNLFILIYFGWRGAFSGAQAIKVWKPLAYTLGSKPPVQSYIRSRDSSVSLIADWSTGRSRFDPRQGQKDFSFSLCVQTGSGAHPASCKMATGGPFLEAKGRGVALTILSLPAPHGVLWDTSNCQGDIVMWTGRPTIQRRVSKAVITCFI